MTLALIRRDFAFLCRKTTADLHQIDCNAYSKITAGCQQIVSNFYLTAPRFLDGRIGGMDAIALYLASRKGEQ